MSRLHFLDRTTQTCPPTTPNPLLPVCETQCCPPGEIHLPPPAPLFAFLPRCLCFALSLIFLPHLFCIMTPPLPPLLFISPPPLHLTGMHLASSPRAGPCPGPLCTHTKPRCIRLPALAVTYMTGRRPASGNCQRGCSWWENESSGGILSPSRSAKDDGRN